VDEIKKIMATKDIPEGFSLRVGVRGGGCSGMSYILGFDKLREHDTTFEVEGITVYMDKRHGLYLMGTVVDYHDGLNARGFTFENPNATKTCGCGSSFAA
jgi:iron-sulfur cluster assembly protein